MLHKLSKLYWLIVDSPSLSVRFNFQIFDYNFAEQTDAKDKCNNTWTFSNNLYVILYKLFESAEERDGWLVFA